MTTKADKTLRRIAALATVVPLGLGLAACGDDDDTATGSGGEGGETLSIATPSDGDEVGSSFEVEVDSSEDLGPTDSGMKHIHVYYDDETEEYDVVESNTFTVDRELDEGEHTIKAALANADHSETGTEDEITVTVGAGGGGGGGGGDGSDDDGGGYDY